MERKKTDILIFLEKQKERPKLTEEQLKEMDFEDRMALNGCFPAALIEADDFEAASKYGTVIGDDEFVKYGKSQKETIKELIRKYKPQWVIGLGNSATLLLPYHYQRKILVNPKVGYDDLNLIPPFAVENTYGFFSSNNKESYELFKRVYPNAVFIPYNRYSIVEPPSSYLHVDELDNEIRRIIGI